MSYIGNTPGVSSQRVVLEEVITGSPKSAFTPISGYIKGYLDVLVNGVEIDTADYTAADGVTVTLTTAAAVGDTVKIKTWLPRGLSDGYLKTEADARFLNLAGGTLTGGLTAAGNFLMTANDGGARVVGVSNGTNTTLVLQGGGNGAGALGANIELGRDGNGMFDAGVSRFRSLDGSTQYGEFNSSGLSLPTGGIKFPATQNPSSDANTLDDYEEGTWTPTCYDQSGSLLTAGTHYFVQSARYVKVGRIVSCVLRISDIRGTPALLQFTPPFQSTEADYSVGVTIPYASTGAGEIFASTVSLFQYRSNSYQYTYKFGSFTYIATN